MLSYLFTEKTSSLMKEELHMKKTIRIMAAIIYAIAFILVGVELLIKGYWEIVLLGIMFNVPIMATISGEDL